MRNLATTLLTSDEVRIMGVDLSYRDTGAAVAVRKNDHLNIQEFYNYRNPVTFNGFDGVANGGYAASSTIRKLNRLYCSFGADAIVIELPCYGRGAQTAMAIGLIVGACLNEFKETAIFIRPQELKTWAGAKKGGGKTEVAKKVFEREMIEHKNDNIIDAIGICCMFNDEITKLKNEAKNS